MKLRTMVALVGLVMVFPESSTAQIAFGGYYSAARDTTVINVSGMGEVIVPPSRAIVFFELSSRESVPSAAAQANEVLHTAVAEALEGLGYSRDQVVPWGYGAGQSNDMMRGARPPGSEIVPSYEVRYGVRVTVEPVERLNEIVSAAMAAGVKAVPMVLFQVADEEDARRRATRLAVSRARADAEAIAEAAGGRLGALVGISTFPEYDRSMMGNRFFSGGFPGQGVQLIPSDLTVRQSIHGVWIFEPGGE
ncbi:MAG: SIMPL domain-containing protein [Gemmatimonadota bacterium]|nr:SIMPL domain-containing protein [Gemmatimonadota bacterium]